MAPFNWFNRQHSDKAASETTPAVEAAEPPNLSEDKAQAETAAEGTAPTVAQDQLAWAKAAYENIRKRKEEDKEEEPSIAPAESVPAESASLDTATEAAETVDASEPLPLVEESVEASVMEEPAIEEDAIAAPASEPVANAADLPQPQVEPTEAEPVSPASLPFWAQAEAERLERLERLRIEAEAAEIKAAASAASTVEPTATVADSTSTIPDFVLDEAFLWSAEVLASQGRRPEDVSIEEITWLKRLRQGLDKTRRTLVNQLRSIVGQGPLNQDAVLEIESLLLQADVGIEATDYIIESLQSKLREEALPPAEAIAYLKNILREMLDRPLGDSHSLTFVPEKDKLNIWLITGVNGAGKTTTIGKLAHIANKSGYRCLIAAADTFRAAAVQQVKVWGERSQVEVIANPGKNTDPAAVVFDGITAAQSRGTELLLIDTAGRLQNKKNLMDELSKIRRIIDKKAPDAEIESLLVLDATLGQNGLRQAQVFSEVAKLSGVVLTKLDGTAKGGIALAVVQQLGLPIRFIGAGEGIEDLRPFSSYEFIEALLSG